MHTCPECGSACYCGGDIDDIDTCDARYEQGCICCLDAGFDDDDYDCDPYNEDVYYEETDDLPI